MSSNLKTTEAGLLEKYRVALKNVKEQPVILAAMTEYGYDDVTIEKGHTLLNTARLAYSKNKNEDDETSEAKEHWDVLKQELTIMYRKHRRKSRVIFRNDPVALTQLDLNQSLPEAYVDWLESIGKFYSVALANDTIKQKMLRLKISDEELTAGEAKVSAVKEARTSYLLEVGESQDATKTKDKALSEIAVWMREFYDVARIALEDHPQLLEALGLKVRS